MAIVVQSGQDTTGCDVFISYAHEDVDFMRALKRQLDVLVNAGTIDCWEDSHIEAGEAWLSQILARIAGCHIALLLVSEHFLSSPFIYREELPLLTSRRRRGEVAIIPIIVRPCAWQQNGELAELQVLPRDERGQDRP